MSSEHLFHGSTLTVNEVYQYLLSLLEEIGAFTIEVKKTSIHFVSKKAFAGIHPKKNWLDVNLVSKEALLHKNLTKVEQVSKNRYHNNFRLNTIQEADADFVSLLKDSYLLMS